MEVQLLVHSRMWNPLVRVIEWDREYATRPASGLALDGSAHMGPNLGLGFLFTSSVTLHTS